LICSEESQTRANIAKSAMYRAKDAFDIHMAIALPKLTILSSVLMIATSISWRSTITSRANCGGDSKRLSNGCQTVVKRLSNGGRGVKDLQTGMQIAGHGFFSDRNAFTVSLAFLGGMTMRTYTSFFFAYDLLVNPCDLKGRQKRTHNRNAPSGQVHHLHHLRRMLSKPLTKSAFTASFSISRSFNKVKLFES